MYFLTAFIGQNFKKALRADPKIQGCAIFTPKMACLSWKMACLSCLSYINKPCHIHSCLSKCKKSESDVNSLTRYFWLKNTETWLSKSIFFVLQAFYHHFNIILIQFYLLLFLASAMSFHALLPIFNLNLTLAKLMQTLNYILNILKRNFFLALKLSIRIYNLTREEQQATYNLKNDQSIVIKEATMGSAVVLWD